MGLVWVSGWSSSSSSSPWGLRCLCPPSALCLVPLSLQVLLLSFCLILSPSLYPFGNQREPGQELPGGECRAPKHE